jgi:hypothetical protein
MNSTYETFTEALRLLDGRLTLNGSEGVSLVVCGGTALNALNLVHRTTKDVDVVALMDVRGQLVDPAPLPQALLIAIKEIADTLDLPSDWLNNGPSSGDGGLFRLGLPEGFKERLVKHHQGEKLSVYLVSRLDQIHFKLYADLRELRPTEAELLMALRWAVTHDPSEGFQIAIRLFLREFGYERLADRI